MTENTQTRRVTRRQALRGAGAVAAGAAASLAGCSVPFLGSSDPVLDITINPLSMVVTVDKNADVDTVSIYPPEGGDPIKTSDMTVGRRKVVLETVKQRGLSMRLLPTGTYRIVAGRGGETVAERSIELVPNPNITSIKPDIRNGTPTGNLALRLKNTGTLPAAINSVEINGVPYPISGDADAELARQDKVAAPQDRLASLPDRVKRMVTPDSTGTFVTKTPAFVLYRDNILKYTRTNGSETKLPVPCVDKQWTASVHLKLVYHTLARQFTYSLGGQTTVLEKQETGKTFTCSNISVQPAQNQSPNNSSSQ